MTYGVDTSVLLRVLMGQPVALAQKVRARLKDLWRSGVKCSVCDVVVSEAYYALQHSYGISKERAILALKRLSENPGFKFSDAACAALATPNLAKASPGFIDRVIHGTYVPDADGEHMMLTCERDAKKLGAVEVIREN